MGDTVQNANLINAGRIEEKIVDISTNLIPNNSNLIANYAMPSEKYIDLDIPNTTSPYEYIAPNDGYICCTYYANSSALILGVDPTSTENTDYLINTSKRCAIVYSTSNWADAFNFPVLKGEKCVFMFYRTTGRTQYCRFVYARGVI